MSYKTISLFLSTTFFWTLAAQAQINPAGMTLGPSQQQQFSAGSSSATWSVVPAGTGTITATGLYTAPASYSASYVFIYAKVGSVYYQTQVKLSPTRLILGGSASADSVSISVSPASIYLYAGQSTQFTATVGGTSNQQVTWSVLLGSGSIVNGLYTAPTAVSGSSLVTISATSAVDRSKTASATILLGPAVSSAPVSANVSISVKPKTTSLSASQSIQLNATVRGSSNSAVTWSLSPNVGSVANGLYTAPATINTAKNVTITATSVADSTQSANSTVSLIASTPAVTPAPTSVTPSAITLAPAGTSQFSVQNLPSGTTVAWSVSPATGTLAQSGLYTAPSTVSSQQTLTVTAKNLSTQSVLGTASLTLTASPAPPPPPPTSVSPTTATVAPAGTKQFTVQNLPSGATVAWSVSPASGSIDQTGTYTAPTTVANQATLTVTAKNSSTLAVLGTATLTLQATPPPTSVSPATATVAPAGTKQFSVQNLPSGATVAWSVSAATGSIAQSGVYTAPATVATQATLTVTAKDSSTQAILGTATLTLQATPLPTSVSPTTATVAPAAIKQFSVQNLPSGASTIWSISPTTGSVAQSGAYTAPSNVATQTTVVVTAKNSSTQTVFGTATITLQASPVTPPSVSPSTVTVAPSGTTQFSVQNLPSGASATWSISPAAGSITQSGVYKAPNSVATTTMVVITAKNSSTQAVLGTATLTLQASPAAPATTTSITLPIEVVGPDGTSSTASFTIPQGINLAGSLQLWMQIHNLKYETEASVQVNNSPWWPISTGNVTLLANAAAFGGIGGGFHTLQMTMNLPAGTVVTGTNTITFRFNGTNGVVSGYRVLAFNVQSSGNNLVDSSQFVQDDPNDWQPPSTSGSDIATGQSLWRTASLTVPVNGSMQTIKAHCSDCHSEDGRDLKYFNYSNTSIEARSTFHGLTAQQAQQIASYIRSLNVPNPGRPWNPPYQPGPGLDSQPVANWSAGAGLDAVLGSDADMASFLAPGGSTAGWSATSNLNAREIPTSLQLLDWNSWLPVVHPMDAFGSAFTSSQLNLALPAIRSILQPNSPTAYHRALEPIEVWFGNSVTFLSPYITNSINHGWTDSMVTNVYSVALWEMVKMWELNQEFGLEGMPQVPYGAKADVRGWFAGSAFATAPNMLHLPTSPALGNGTATAKDYLTLIWYHTQLVQNSGQGTQSGHGPIDFGYVYGYVKVVFSQEAVLPGSMELMEFLVKDLQEVTLTGTGPQEGALGWHVTNTSPFSTMVFYNWPLWSGTSPDQQTALTQAYAQAWVDQASKYTPQQYYQGGWATPTEDPATDSWSGTLGGQIWFMLPRLRYMGVSNTLLNQISAWAATIFPKGNWSLNNTASCNPVSGPCASGL